MAFKAASGPHAIVEVAFGLILNRPWQPREIERLVASHKEHWKSDLPRMFQMEAHQLQIDPQGRPTTSVVPAPGVSFDRVKPDGDIGWRVRVEQNTVFVNCLDYTSWTDAWAQAEVFLRRAIEVSGSKDQAVTGLVLQYIDVFNWEGDDSEYDVSELLRLDGKYMPSHVGQHGHVWHHHSGWFVSEDDPVPGSLLHRVHFDATKGKHPTVRMDTLLRKDLDTSAPFSAEGMNGIDGVMRWMHDRNKELIRLYLTDGMLHEIGLQEGT